MTHHIRNGLWARWKEPVEILSGQVELAAPFSLPTASKADLHAFSIGTGDAVLSSVTPSLLAARHELLFVTCFWSTSSSLGRIREVLSQLSKHARSQSPPKRIRVRICISSLSLLQKLFHTQSPGGYIYPPAQWHTKLGLLSESDLPGIDLQVKSVFIKPFSVMHPKFVVVDRRHVLLPSCNVSWEDWLEGCLSLSGSVVGDFVDFWRTVWEGPGFEIPSSFSSATNSQDESTLSAHASSDNAELLLGRANLSNTNVPVILLPHPHRVNPLFRPFFFLHAPPAPRTPLNAVTLHLIDSARSDIFMQTPNLTSPPVLEAVCGALKRGVNVHILTNARLMTLEQILTAGTTTPRCVRRLISWHQSELSSKRKRRGNGDDVIHDDGGENMIGLRGVGDLRIEYFVAASSTASSNNKKRTLNSTTSHVEPVRSHLKLMVVDGEVALLGSGNMDRASWFTSQELGLAVHSREVAGKVSALAREALRGRTTSALHV